MLMDEMGSNKSRGGGAGIKGGGSSSSGGMAIRLGRGNKGRDKAEGGMTGGGKRVRVEAVSGEFGADDEGYVTKQSSSRGAGFPVYRMPHVAFAGMLERELLALPSHKSSKEFWELWYPKDPIKHKDYYAKVRQPIFLSDIRENIAQYKYHSYKMFTDDIDLIVSNARLYYPEGHLIPKKAIDVSSF